MFVSTRPNSDFGARIVAARPEPFPKERPLPSLWPHVWAIPLTLLLGFALGWMARTANEEAFKRGDSSPTGPGESDADVDGPDPRLFDD